MILVDISAWFACVVPSDKNHLRASRWLNANNQEAFFTDALCTIYYLTEDDIKETWQVFQRFSDKEWSFTDCSSKVVMEKLRINKAFTFDHHFTQFGLGEILP